MGRSCRSTQGGIADIRCICEPGMRHRLEPTFKQMLFRVYLCSAEGRTEPKADAQTCRFGVQRLFQETFSVFKISYTGQVRECPRTVRKVYLKNLYMLVYRVHRTSGFLPCSEAARDMCNIFKPHLLGNLNRKSGSFADRTK
jgi:hypothetical protein